MAYTRLRPGQWELKVGGAQQAITVDDVEFSLDADKTYSIFVKSIARISTDVTKVKSRFIPLTEPGAFKN